jgi:hypothetical protein
VFSLETHAVSEGRRSFTNLAYEGGSMRVAFILALLGTTVLAAQEVDLDKRYGFDVNTEKYAQAKPEDAMKSIITCIQNGQHDYMLAQLADPAFVDRRVAENMMQFQGKEEARRVLAFDLLVKQTADHFRDDPTLLREMKRITEEGEWMVDNDKAMASLPILPGRAVFMKQIKGRWFLENKQKQEKQ